MHVLITGGTGLVGKELVKGFLSKGFKVTFTSTTDEEALKLCKELGHSEKLNYYIVDLLCEENIEELKDNLKKLNITHLINNARSQKTLKNDENGVASAENFQNEFFIGVTAPYLLSVGLFSSLECVVNISSIYGVVAPRESLYEGGFKDSPIQYGVVKAAQIHLTKELAVRFAKKGIRVNSISFGGVSGRANDDFVKKYSDLCPMGRMLSSSELFGPVEFLCSKESSYMTGHNLIFDGGWCAW